MLRVRLSECTDCASIDAILESIDCFLTTSAKDDSNNRKYELNKCIDNERIEKLTRYKSILIKRRLNSHYLWKIPNAMIISRVKTLLN